MRRRTKAMFSCHSKRKWQDCFFSLYLSLPVSDTSIQPSVRASISSPCLHAYCLPVPWVEETSDSDSALLRPCPELRSHDKGGTCSLTHTHMHTQSHDPSTTELLFHVTEAAGERRYNALPCALPCPQPTHTHTHTQITLRLTTPHITSGFTGHPSRP